MHRIADYVAGLSALSNQLKDQVHALVAHGGEKGRAAEHIVRTIVRTILPKKFSVGSGFIVTSSGRSSGQLDIVLFDEQMNAPISLIGEIGVFPFECVYGFIEVKHALTWQAIQQTAMSIGQIRKFRSEKFYQAPMAYQDEQGRFGVQLFKFNGKLAPRSYIVAFDTSYSSIEALEAAMKKASDKFDAFFHGVLILNAKKDWFVRQYATKKGKPKKFVSTRSNAMKAFALKLSKDTVNYPMYPADMEQYLGELEREA